MPVLPTAKMLLGENEFIGCARRTRTEEAQTEITAKQTEAEGDAKFLA